MQNALRSSPKGISLWFAKFVILKFEALAYIHAEGEQGQGYLGFYPGVVIFYGGVVAKNIDYCAEHSSSYENCPRLTGGSNWFSD